LLAVTLAAGAGGLAAGDDAPLEALGLDQRWTDDLDGMVERRQIRVLVTHNMTNYFIDGGQQRGATYDLMREFEKSVNKKRGLRTRRVSVVFLPVTRDQLIPALLSGRGDIAAANLTITPQRQRLVDFSEPFVSGIKEIVVTGPAAPPIRRYSDLSGREVWVRPSSSFHESLLELSRRFERAGIAPIRIRQADEYLETEDLLEMANAGLIAITIADDHMAGFWSGVFDKLTLHPELPIRQGGQIAWAFRKHSPLLKSEVDTFLKRSRKGTLLGNIVYKRYLKDNQWVRDPTRQEEMDRFRSMVEYFRSYADRYSFDWLMLAAQGYQESGLDQKKRSRAGAVGVMQILPSTAADPAVGISNIHQLGPNIHAGVKYLRWIIDTYFADSGIDQLDRGLFAMAAYNAGPNRIARLRRKAAGLGLDPDQWFGNVELVVAREVGREPVQYVDNIYKYYVSYRLIAEKLGLKGQDETRALGMH
jgi:membrane-bound lytic murein transglycosylase MltF